MITNSKVYDVLKWIQRIVIPAVATLYLALGTIWEGIINVPFPEQVAATLTAVDTLLGALLGISHAQYDKASEEADGKNE